MKLKEAIRLIINHYKARRFNKKLGAAMAKRFDDLIIKALGIDEGPTTGFINSALTPEDIKGLFSGPNT